MGIAWQRCLEKSTAYGARNWEGGLAGDLLQWNRPPAQAGAREEVGKKDVGLKKAFILWQPWACLVYLNRKSALER